MLKQFDIRSIKFDNERFSTSPFISIIGKSGSGKSVLVKDLLFHHKDIPMGNIVSSDVEQYADIVPAILHHHTYKSEIAENMIIRQKRVTLACAPISSESSIHFLF
jgi:ABC-type phosphate/phosphonate transport system ATPase subunit